MQFQQQGQVDLGSAFMQGFNFILGLKEHQDKQKVTALNVEESLNNIQLQAERLKGYQADSERAQLEMQLKRNELGRDKQYGDALAALDFQKKQADTTMAQLDAAFNDATFWNRIDTSDADTSKAITEAVTAAEDYAEKFSPEAVEARKAQVLEAKSKAELENQQHLVDLKRWTNEDFIKGLWAAEDAKNQKLVADYNNALLQQAQNKAAIQSSANAQFNNIFKTFGDSAQSIVNTVGFRTIPTGKEAEQLNLHRQYALQQIDNQGAAAGFSPDVIANQKAQVNFTFDQIMQGNAMPHMTPEMKDFVNTIQFGAFTNEGKAALYDAINSGKVESVTKVASDVTKMVDVYAQNEITRLSDQRAYMLELKNMSDKYGGAMKGQAVMQAKLKNLTQLVRSNALSDTGDVYLVDKNGKETRVQRAQLYTQMAVLGIDEQGLADVGLAELIPNITKQKTSAQETAKKNLKNSTKSSR